MQSFPYTQYTAYTPHCVETPNNALLSSNECDPSMFYPDSQLLKILPEAEVNVAQYPYSETGRISLQQSGGEDNYGGANGYALHPQEHYVQEELQQHQQQRKRGASAMHRRLDSLGNVHGSNGGIVSARRKRQWALFNNSVYNVCGSPITGSSLLYM